MPGMPASETTAMRAAGFECFDQFGGAVRARCAGGSLRWGCDLEVVEQLLRLAGVFAGDAVDALEHIEGAQGDVAEVADGRGDEVEAGGECVGCRLGLLDRRACGLGSSSFPAPASSRSMRRCSASRDMELIRFCTLTMPTTRPLSVTGISARPWPAVRRRMVVPSVSSGRATWKARDMTDCT